MKPNKRSLKPPGRSGRIPLNEIAEAVNTIHVLPAADDGWTVRAIGSAWDAQQFSSKEDALAYARGMTRPRPAQIVVHDRNGSISRLTM